MASALNSLKEVTASKGRCSDPRFGDCPRMFELGDGRFAIIGEEIKREKALTLGWPLAQDEVLVRIPSDILPKEFSIGASLPEFINVVGEEAEKALLNEQPEGDERTIGQMRGDAEVVIHIERGKLQNRLDSIRASVAFPSAG